jgi:N-acetylneuraminic acid mutarotase
MASQFAAFGHEDIDFSISGTGTYCINSYATLNYTVHGFAFTAGNVLRAELSDATGSFSSPLVIGTLSSTTDTGLINIKFPSDASGPGYRIRIVSSSPAVTGSDNGTDLTISPSTTVSLSIAAAVSNILCDTHDATFNATPIGGGTSPVYQWHLNGNTAGINSATFDGTGLQNGDRVFCKMTSNTSCPSPETVSSNTITIIQRTTTAPVVTIAGPPVVCSGVDTQFTATPLNGGSAPLYQWKKNGDNVGTNSTTYTASSLVSGDVLSCVMTSNRECVTSPTATSSNLAITVNAKVTPTIQITADPAETVGAGSVIYLSSVITNGGISPDYQWKRNGTVISSISSNALSLTTLDDGDIITAFLTSKETCAQPIIVQSNSVTISIDPKLTKSKHAWEPRASQSDGANALVRSNGIGFSIGSKGFVGLGTVMTQTGVTYRTDLWEYDPATDVWTQKADFPGDGRHNAVGFSIQNRGFIGTGYSAAGTRKDFWQFEPTSNSWTQRADFPGTAREQAFGFSIGTKGYIGGGFTNGQGDYKDFYEFDPSSNTWHARAEFGGGKRMGSATFNIDQKGFVAGGYSSSSDTWYKDLWDFDQEANLWTRRADMPGNGRTRATGFAAAGSGYVGLGYSKDGYEGQFFQYTLSSNTWSWKPYYPGPVSHNFAAGMSIGNRPFVYKDGKWFEYNIFTVSAFGSKLCSTESVTLNWDASGFTFGAGNVFTAQISRQLNFSNRTALASTISQASTGTFTATVPASVAGEIYYFRIVSTNPVMSTLFEQVVITALPPNHIILAETGATVCKDTPAQFQSNLTGTGFQWYKNNKPVGSDSPSYADSKLASGDVIRSVRSYTSGCYAPVGLGSNLINMTVKEPQKPSISVAPNTLSCTPATAYQWFIDGNQINGATSQSYRMTKNGKYKVRIADNSGCFAFSDEIANVYVGLEDDFYSAEISMFPNPTPGEVTLQLSDNLVSRGCQYSVINDLGQIVVGTQLAEQTNRINLAGRASGLYVVRLSLNGQTIVRRFLKVE